MGRHEKELSQQGRQLRDLGLINPEEYNRNPVDWIRKHLEVLFGHEWLPMLNDYSSTGARFSERTPLS